MDTKFIVKIIGRKVLSKELRVTETAIFNAEVSLFPASWYGIIKSLCDNAGIDCPLRLFNFKTACEHPNKDAILCTGNEVANG